MKITFADSFWKSLKTHSRHQTWWYKTYEVFRYKIPAFFENIWFFRKELWDFRPYDYGFNLMIFGKSIQKTSKYIMTKGYEIDETRFKSVQKMNRVVEIINNMNESNYIKRAEVKLGEVKNTGFFEKQTIEDREHNKKVYDLADKIEKQEWEELFVILKGQDHNDFVKLYDEKKGTHEENENLYNQWFDGTGMKHWWD